MCASPRSKAQKHFTSENTAISTPAKWTQHAVVSNSQHLAITAVAAAQRCSQIRMQVFNTRSSACTAGVLHAQQQQQEYRPHSASARTEQLRRGEKLQTRLGGTGTQSRHMCCAITVRPACRAQQQSTGEVQIQAQAQCCSSHREQELWMQQSQRATTGHTRKHTCVHNLTVRSTAPHQLGAQHKGTAARVSHAPQASSSTTQELVAALVCGQAPQQNRKRNHHTNYT